MTGVSSIWRTCWGGREGPGVGFILVLQFLASWPVFLHQKHLPSLMHFACSWGESFLSLMTSTSMAFGSGGVRVEGEFGVLKLEGRVPLLISSMRSFWLWKVFAFAIHPSRESGGSCMDKIMVEICQSSPMENWVTAVSLSLNCAFVARFSKSLIYSWNPSLGVPSSSFPGLWTSLARSHLARTLASRGLKFSL